METRQGARQRIIDILGKLDSAVVAFSGGVDSTLLLRLAKMHVRGRIEAVTVSSPVHPGWEVQEATETAAAMGVSHRILQSEAWDSPEFRANRSDRCYQCKREIMALLLAYGRERGLAVVVEGSHAGDRADDRPGLKALSEFGIRSPLREAGLAKREIREWAHELGLANWDRPPRACLATRIPKGRPITRRKLQRVERAEEILRKMAFRQFRARHHGRSVRIQVGADEVPRLTQGKLRWELIRAMEAVGYREVWIDLKGYGSSE